MALLLLGTLVAAAAIVSLCFSLGIVGVSDRSVRRRLESVDPRKRFADEGGVRLRAAEARKGIGRIVATRGTVEKLERNLMLAGRPEGMTVNKILGIKVAGLAVGLLVLVAMVSTGAGFLAWIIGLGAMVFGYVAPDVIALNRAEARQKAIQRELPDVLDQVTISLESGLAFETAFSHIGENRTGPLADEIVRTMQDMRLGMSRREAYQALADRTDVEDINRFSRSITQADQYGVSIATVVRNQAQEMRLSRRKRAEAAAMKVPVKIVFPLLLCILPVLFIVILTPAAMRIIETFGK